MAKKKKRTSGIQKSYKRLKGDLKDLGKMEKDLEKVKTNLRTFLDQIGEASGPEYLVERLDKIQQNNYSPALKLLRNAVPSFFYLDLDDTRRRAALLTLAVRHKVPALASLKREYARALAQIGGAPLNTAGKPRVCQRRPHTWGLRARNGWSMTRSTHHATAPRHGLLQYAAYNTAFSSWVFSIRL